MTPRIGGVLDEDFLERALSPSNRCQTSGVWVEVAGRNRPLVGPSLESPVVGPLRLVAEKAQRLRPRPRARDRGSRVGLGKRDWTRHGRTYVRTQLGRITVAGVSLAIAGATGISGLSTQQEGRCHGFAAGEPRA